ncbi:penicillin-binding transpeptidase domain-containing protein [Vibrio neonatus]|uniref:penicillin-binding transpeptidase domain-containing protein n=1 Tax=Vibrio neonatus TaxID=278860 RepID=UPI0021C2BB69|nr:penicillin-binding transpeptidase domain-containing protein [Vibrio neonatus]
MKSIKKKTTQAIKKRIPKIEPEKLPAADTRVIKWRYQLVLGFILALLGALLLRVAYIQVIEPDSLIKQGDMRSVRVKALPSARGIISDRNGEQIAVSVPVEAVYADPRTIFEKGDALQDVQRWHALADVLYLDREALIHKIDKNKNRRFIYLQRQVSPAMAKYIKQLKLKGVGLRDESRRYYPTGEVSAHVVGVTGIDSHGLEGVEKSYDKWLSGHDGSRKVRKDRDGRVVENISMTDSEQGRSLQLTIDQRLQAIAYRSIKQAVADHRATSGSIVLVDVKTGGILAMVNTPSYNPNTRDQLQSFKMRNRAITDALEAGSSVKPFVVLAALETHTADLNTVIDTGNGIMRVGGNRVRDSVPVGKANLATILKKSSNIGVTHLALNMPIESLEGMYQSVGFGSVSGINLVGETPGLFPSRRRWSKIEIATFAFGYGLSITPLQLAHAYATLGSYGSFKPLHIVKDAKDLPSPKQVADPDNVRKVLDMLEGVTQKGGTATKARVPGYRVGAKTGTSRKANAGGYSDEYVAITAGVAPISNPRLALVVVVNDPQGDSYYGGEVAAPVFSEVLKSALQILNVPPDANTD